MDVHTQIRQLYWRSKRGLLELDLLLLPFADSCLGQLSADELAQYGQLLEYDDLDLYDWLRGRSADTAKRSENLQPIVARIREFHCR